MGHHPSIDICDPRPSPECPNGFVRKRKAEKGMHFRDILEGERFVLRDDLLNFGGSLWEGAESAATPDIHPVDDPCEFRPFHSDGHDIICLTLPRGVHCRGFAGAMAPLSSVVSQFQALHQQGPQNEKEEPLFAQMPALLDRSTAAAVVGFRDWYLQKEFQEKGPLVRRLLCRAYTLGDGPRHSQMVSPGSYLFMYSGPKYELSPILHARFVPEEHFIMQTAQTVWRWMGNFSD